MMHRERFAEQEDRNYYLQDEERDFQIKMQEQRTERFEMFLNFLDDHMLLIAIVILPILSTIIIAILGHH